MATSNSSEIVQSVPPPWQWLSRGGLCHQWWCIGAPVRSGEVCMLDKDVDLGNRNWTKQEWNTWRLQQSTFEITQGESMHRTLQNNALWGGHSYKLWPTPWPPAHSTCLSALGKSKLLTLTKTLQNWNNLQNMDESLPLTANLSAILHQVIAGVSSSWISTAVVSQLPLLGICRGSATS